MKIAHLADAHLDSAFALFSPDAARQRRQAIEGALRRAVEAALDAKAEALLVAGDLYEHDRVSPDTGAFMLALLRDAAPMRVFVAPGNHDWYGPASLYARLDWPEHVHIFTIDRLEPVQLADGLTLWGGAHRAPANTDGFLDGFRVDRGGTHVALFHGSEQSAFGFQDEGKVPHAPFRAEQAREAGLSHVFCGHYHTALDRDIFTYPGNPEPLAFGESGNVQRGLVLATIASDGSVVRERRAVAVTEVHDLAVDLTGCANGNEVRQRLTEQLAGLTGCARVTVHGELAPEVDVSPADIQRSAPAASAVIARVGALTRSYDLEAIRVEGTVRGQFVADVLASELPDSLRQKIVVTGLRALEGRTDLEVV